MATMANDRISIILKRKVKTHSRAEKSILNKNKHNILPLLNKLSSMKYLLITLLVFLSLTGCKKSTPQETYFLIFKFKFDSTQARLNNIGQPSVIPAGNAALSPVFNKMSAHYIELAPTATTQLGQGLILYKATETTSGGGNAIDFSKAYFAGNGEAFFSIPISDGLKGNFQWLRLSLAYQNYDVKYRLDTIIGTTAINGDFTGTVASFIGYNTYIQNHTVKTQSVAVNSNKAQGYWSFETTVNGIPVIKSGDAPANATTVVNPLFATSPVPAGSCVVTAAFNPGNLVIAGNETKDIVVEISLSTNKSFEWKDNNANGKWDPLKGEQVVDMGIRGMIPKLQ